MGQPLWPGIEADCTVRNLPLNGKVSSCPSAASRGRPLCIADSVVGIGEKKSKRFVNVWCAKTVEWCPFYGRRSIWATTLPGICLTAQAPELAPETCQG